MLLPAEATGLETNSKAQVGQLSAVSKARLSHKLGTVPPALMQQISRKIKPHLGLD
ncbi:type II toxin-antitoxin system PemK/MazF family toxin [Calidithermus roseus]|uniref:type II toxin-antitoxin system PemK/MazF family toxin n=1 Tax=Calidithermus roseus TaxID=1644118 RepID=UPI0015FBD8CC